jgi:rhodanese-related sulfurtransferase
MKRVALLAMLGVLVLFIACTYGINTKDAPRISKDALKAKLGSPDLVLLDVRSKKDWEKSSEKITGAVQMDPETLDTWSETLPKEKEIVLYCA